MSCISHWGMVSIMCEYGTQFHTDAVLLWQDCEFNPKKPVLCDKGCGLTMPKDELHVCHTFLHIWSVICISYIASLRFLRPVCNINSNITINYYSNCCIFIWDCLFSQLLTVDRVRIMICAAISLTSTILLTGTLMLGAEHQSAQMSKLQVMV